MTPLGGSWRGVREWKFNDITFMVSKQQNRRLKMARLMPIKLVEDHSFQFTTKWFLNTNLPSFRDFIYPVWKDKLMSYVEIGVYEGMSLVWMMQYVLTHPESHAIGIDPWLMTTKSDEDYMEAVRLRAHHNLAPWKDRCKLIRGNSNDVIGKALSSRGGFSRMKRNSIDLCFVDGDHHKMTTMGDGELGLQLVRPGGWIMFDQINTPRNKKGFAKDGLNLFLERNKQSVKLIWRNDYMEAYEKL